MNVSTTAETLLSKNQLARRLDCDVRRLNRIIEVCRVRPDFMRGQENLFRSGRVPELRQILNKEAA